MMLRSLGLTAVLAATLAACASAPPEHPEGRRGPPAEGGGALAQAARVAARTAVRPSERSIIRQISIQPGFEAQPGCPVMSDAGAALRRRNKAVRFRRNC
jgi:hypothetical protein